MDDVTKTPYAQWMEGMIRSIMENKPVRMAVVMVAESGETLTGYYGDRSPEDIASMAWHLNMDAMWEVVSVNADQIVAMAEDAQEAREELDDED